MKYGTVDSNYNIIKEPCERDVQPFNSKFGHNIGLHGFAAEGLVWIREIQTDKIGLATEEGKILIEPSDTLGQTILPAKYASVQIEEDGTFKVFTGGHSGRINKDGELIVKTITGDYIPALPKYDWQYDFDAKGYSKVYYKGNVGVINNKFQLIVRSSKSGIENDIVIPEEYDWWNDFINGLIVVVDKEGKSGIINTEGNIVVEPIYERIRVYRKDDKVLFLCDSTLADADGNIVAVASYIDITMLNVLR